MGMEVQQLKTDAEICHLTKQQAIQLAIDMKVSHFGASSISVTQSLSYLEKHYLSAHNSAEDIKYYQTALRLQPDISHLRQSGQTHKHERWVQQITSTTMASEICSVL